MYFNVFCNGNIVACTLVVDFCNKKLVLYSIMKELTVILRYLQINLVVVSRNFLKSQGMCDTSITIEVAT